MKKFLVIMVILISIGMLAACGEKNKNESSSEKIAEPVTIKVYDTLASEIRLGNGWLNDYLTDKYNIVVETVKKDDKDVDIYIDNSVLELVKEEYVDGGLVLEWDKQLYDEYCINIEKYHMENTQEFIDLCDGKMYGFEGQRGNLLYMISKNTDNIIEVMQFLDWLASPESRLCLENGLKGLCWDVDDNGCYYLTEFGKDCKKNSDTVINKEKGYTYREVGVGMLSNPWWRVETIPDTDPEQSFKGNDW